MERSKVRYPLTRTPVFYPHFTIGFCETASEAYAVFDCFTIPSVATGLTSHFKKMWVKDRSFKQGMNGPTFRGVMGGESALALRQFAKPDAPPPYQRYTHRIPEYAQSLAYLAE